MSSSLCDAANEHSNSVIIDVDLLSEEDNTHPSKEGFSPPPPLLLVKRERSAIETVSKRIKREGKGEGGTSTRSPTPAPLSPILHSTQSPTRRSMSAASSSLVSSSQKESSEWQTPAIPPLSSTQTSILNLVKRNRSVFITGGAGTGKTFLLRAIRAALPLSTTFVTATTGIAALQLGGSTLHSFAGCGIVRPNESQQKVYARIKKNKMVIQRWVKCERLIIDEVSMLSTNFFKTLEYLARKFRGSSQPFGGIQLILCGDFLQLPPVGRGYPQNIAPFCFESRAWLRCNPKVCILSEPFRQQDETFFHILREMRIGYVSSLSLAVLRNASTSVNTMYVHDAPDSSPRQTMTPKGTIVKLEDNSLQEEIKRSINYNPGIVVTDDKGNELAKEFDGYIFLRPRRVDVDSQNASFYSQLDTPEYFFKGFREGEGRYPENDLPVDLHLRVGCRVMLTKNTDVVGGLVNGTCGTVTRFYCFKKSTAATFSPLDASRICVGSSMDGPATPHSFVPVVEFEVRRSAGNIIKCEIVVGPAEWTQMQGDVVISRDVQLPLIVAYAITIHKSQGMSLTQVDIDFTHIFEAGQAYVALSRCTNMNTARIHGFHPSIVLTSDVALSYYHALQFLRTVRQARSGSENENYIYPCGYACSAELAEEDDNDIRSVEMNNEWNRIFGEDRAARRRQPTLRRMLQNESTELDALRRRIGPMMEKGNELKKMVQERLLPLYTLKNVRLVVDEDSVWELFDSDPEKTEGGDPHSLDVESGCRLPLYSFCCEEHGNMIRVPNVVSEFFHSSEKARAPSSSYDGLSQGETEERQRVWLAMERARMCWLLDIQRGYESASLPELREASMEPFRYILPAFSSSTSTAAEGSSNSLGSGAMCWDRDLANFLFRSDSSKSAQHTAILAYATYLAQDQTGVDVVVCTASDTLAASAIGVGLRVTSCATAMRSYCTG